MGQAGHFAWGNLTTQLCLPAVIVVVVVMMAIMPVVAMSNMDHHLRICRDGQGRSEQQQKSQAKQNLFHIGFDSSTNFDACLLRRVV